VKAYQLKEIDNLNAGDLLSARATEKRVGGLVGLRTFGPSDLQFKRLLALDRVIVPNVIVDTGLGQRDDTISVPWR
jgi:hypothetical protein